MKSEPRGMLGRVKSRREVLRGMAGLGLLALGSCAGEGAGAPRDNAELAALVDGITGVDMHSHAAGAGAARVPTYDLAARMRQGRFTAVCLCHSADGPVIRRDADNRIRTARRPNPGELWGHTERRLHWFDELMKDQGLRRALAAGDLAAARRDRAPAIVQAIEGCQFMEGRLERIGEVFRRGVRHLQLVHYFISDLGDNQTETADQGGLTPLGREVIAECNRLGIVVDVAHGTLELVEAAAKASATPLILSHTAVARGRPQPFSRLISKDHARAVAQTGGVVGIWGNPVAYRPLAQYAQAVATAVDAAGVDHVGIGTDNSGMGATPVVWSDYAEFPRLVAALRAQGFSAEEIGKIAGGNYLRVFDRSMHPSSGGRPDARAEALS